MYGGYSYEEVAETSCRGKEVGGRQQYYRLQWTGKGKGENEAGDASPAPGANAQTERYLSQVLEVPTTCPVSFSWCDEICSVVA